MLSIYSIPSIYCCSLLEYKHPFISYKIVQCAGTFIRKKGSSRRCFAESPNEYTRVRGEASRMGHEKFPGELNIQPSIESSCRDVWNHDDYKIRCYNGRYIKCCYL